MKKSIIIISVFIVLMGITVFVAMDERGFKLNDFLTASQDNQRISKSLKAVNIQPVVTQKKTIHTIQDNQITTNTNLQQDYPVRQTTVKTEIAQTESSDLSGSMDEIKSLLIKMDSRITELERNIEGVRVQQRSGIESSIAHSSEANSTDEELANNTDDDDSGISAQQQQKQLAKEQYYISLEQNIAAEANPIVADDISNRYSEMFKSREDWSNKVALESSECGGSYCKVVVSYDNDLDDLSEFELDAMLFMPTAQDYPLSKSSYTSKPDGSKQVTIYFAAKGNEFPLEQG